MNAVTPVAHHHIRYGRYDPLRRFHLEYRALEVDAVLGHRRVERVNHTHVDLDRVLQRV